MLCNFCTLSWIQNVDKGFWEGGPTQGPSEGQVSVNFDLVASAKPESSYFLQACYSGMLVIAMCRTCSKVIGIFRTWPILNVRWPTERKWLVKWCSKKCSFVKIQSDRTETDDDHPESLFVEICEMKFQNLIENFRIYWIGTGRFPVIAQALFISGPLLLLLQNADQCREVFRWIEWNYAR